MMSLIVPAVFALMTLVFAWIFIQAVTSSVTSYREHFTTTANVTFAEMFLFIDAAKVFQLQISLVFFGFFLGWILSQSFIVGVIVAIALGVMPNIIIRLLKKRRRDNFLKQLPDGLLSISTSMKAGSGLNQSIDLMVTEESGPIAEEFGLFIRELRVGLDFDDALDNIGRRMKLVELDLVISGMKISREIGGNLADTLWRLSETIRRKIEMEGKIRSLTSQGKLQGLVMTLLPVFLALVLFQMEPDHMRRLFTEPLGWVTLVIWIVFESIGYFFIRKIVSIDV